MIAVDLGGVYGRGWMNGTWTQLNFILRHATDFIFSVLGKEFGLISTVLLFS